MNTSQPILVTGSNRSGSTWVGKVIATNKNVDTIIEPLNLNRIKRFEKFNINNWYLKVDSQVDITIKNEATLLFSYYLKTSIKNLIVTPFQQYEGHNLLTSFKKRFRRATKPVKLLKDPTSLFSIPWLVMEFNALPIILIRHPAAYVLSIKEKNWWFDFDNFLDQPNFFQGNLAGLKKEVEDFKREEATKSIIENAALFWKICYAQVLVYQMKYPNWYYITHEEISLDPINNFKKIFEHLDLNFTEKVKSYINESTQSRVNSKHSRNAKKNTKKWTHQLSDDEKQVIYNITNTVSNKFYDKFV